MDAGNDLLSSSDSDPPLVDAATDEVSMIQRLTAFDQVLGSILVEVAHSVDTYEASDTLSVTEREVVHDEVRKKILRMMQSALPEARHLRHVVGEAPTAGPARGYDIVDALEFSESAMVYSPDSLEYRQSIETLSDAWLRVTEALKEHKARRERAVMDRLRTVEGR